MPRTWTVSAASGHNKYLNRGDDHGDYDDGNDKPPGINLPVKQIRPGLTGCYLGNFNGALFAVGFAKQHGGAFVAYKLLAAPAPIGSFPFGMNITATFSGHYKPPDTYFL